MKTHKIQLNKTRRDGFTLIELLVTIVIMTILIGVGSGSFVGTNEKLQLQKAANSLLLDAQYARMSAIEQQRTYKLYLDYTNGEFYLITIDNNVESGQIEEILIQDSVCPPIQLEKNINFEDIRVLSNEYEVATTSENLYIVSFFPDGTSQSALIQIGNGKHHYTLSISGMTGKSKLFNGIMDNVEVDTIDLDAEY